MATHPEILDVIRIAADRKVPCYVHMRSPGALEPGSVTESIQEMIADSAITGASIHMVHLTSMALGQTGLAIEMIQSARKRGLISRRKLILIPLGRLASIPRSSMKAGRNGSRSPTKICNGFSPESVSLRDIRQISQGRRQHHPACDP